MIEQIFYRKFFAALIIDINIKTFISFNNLKVFKKL